MLAYLLQGIILGFAAGISPGPMLGLVISQTLRRGWRAGNLVAVAPLISAPPLPVLGHCWRHAACTKLRNRRDCSLRRLCGEPLCIPGGCKAEHCFPTQPQPGLAQGAYVSRHAGGQWPVAYRVGPALDLGRSAALLNRGGASAFHHNSFLLYLLTASS
jgi:hypothetical protein